MLILIALATFVATMLGGIVAVKLRDRLHLILGFSAGAVIGVAFFDLLPEALELGSKFYNFNIITAVVALGFLLYLVLDRTVLLHGHVHDGSGDSANVRRGVLGAGSLAIHSLLDGVGVGLAFQVSNEIGLVVAAAVLAHDFSDGINTVNFLTKNNGGSTITYKWLIIDAIAPSIGIFSTLFITISGASLGLILALFTGFFLYVGASDLIPESHHSHPKLLTTAMTILGAVIMFVVIRSAGI